MDTASTVASWLSFLVTAAGLGSLITQTNAIEERLDPFRTSRSVEYLGTWISRQPIRTRFKLGRPSPVGPIITANLVDGFCGSNQIDVSRLPLETTGTASWTALLAMFHEQQPTPVVPRMSHLRSNTIRLRNRTGKDTDAVETSQIDQADMEKSQLKASPSWSGLPAQQLRREGVSSCIAISCATLITILSIGSSRQIYRYSDASGHRAAYGSYFGFWYINWPLGQAATVSLAPHVSHSLSTDVYPRKFSRRVDRCIRMTAGVITSPDAKSFQCGFSVRKPPGKWILQYQRKGFSGAPGSRHLYYLVGGKVSEVDFLFARKFERDLSSNCLRLSLPSLEKNMRVSMFIPENEQRILDHALDCLPWSSLSWSVHRGLRDILLGYGQRTMNEYRRSLASRLHAAVGENQHRLQTLGWAAAFVKESMADIAFNSVMAGDGNSGDAVRVVTDVALLLCPSLSMLDVDETTFCRQARHQTTESPELSQDAIIALTKFFALEWSNEFDYQMYHDLPPHLMMS